MIHHLTKFYLLEASSFKRVLIEICQGLLQFTFAIRGNIRTLKSTYLACLKKIVLKYILIKIIVKKLNEHQLVIIEDSNLCVKSL